MSNKQRSFWSTPTGWAALVLIGAASYFLLVEHRQHLFDYLPFLILLLCPLMHVFMHGSHGKHEASSVKDTPETFQDLTEKNGAYRDGYLEGLKTGREEKEHKENNNAR